MREINYIKIINHAMNSWLNACSLEDEQQRLECLLDDFGLTAEEYMAIRALADEPLDFSESVLPAEKVPHSPDYIRTRGTRIVHTPSGDLVAYPKHEEDNCLDYPGIYVDLLMPDGSLVGLAVVEWLPQEEALQGCLYADTRREDPTCIQMIDLRGLEDE